MLIKTVQTKVPLAALLPLLPTEVIVGSKDQEEAQDGPEDDYVTREHKRTGPPGDL